MLSRFKFYFLALATASVLAACSGDDGEPGLATSIKKGSFEGTVTGTRQDGTAFSETFTYAYTDETVESFVTSNGAQRLELLRTSSRVADGRYLYLGLQTVSEGVFIPESTEFGFYKELDNDKVFAIDVDAYFEDTDAFVRELSPLQNDIYKFEVYYDGSLYYFNGIDNGVDVWEFYTEMLEVRYSKATGALVSVYDYSTGVRATSGAVFNLYNKLRFKFNAAADVDANVFYDAATNTSLHQLIPAVPADQLLITNYTRNTTGVVTFDFTLKVSGYHENTTGHDLTITGKFNSGGTVYKERGS